MMISKPQKGDRWSKDEMILVFNLYFQIPFRKYTNRTPEVIALAQIMGRTPSSIALRLTNFASCDPILQSEGIKGMNAHKKLCQPYWDEFFENKEDLVFKSEQILAKYQETSIEAKYEKELINIPHNLTGETRMREVKTRVNQDFFRRMVLTNYNNKCALTGIDIPDLLVASHIIPWASNEQERLNPKNGICLSSLYDKAFDSGLISFKDNGVVIFSKRLKANVGKDYFSKYFLPFESFALVTPQRYYPNPLFLEWHRDEIFDK